MGLRTGDLLLVEKTKEWPYQLKVVDVGDATNRANQVTLALYGATVLKWSTRKIFRMGSKAAKDGRLMVAWKKIMHAAAVASEEGFPTVLMVDTLPQPKQGEGANP